MEFFDTIKARHSYRKEFLPEKISREDLQKIVTAGLIAPSGCNAQTTEFVIIDDEELIEQIRELHPSEAVQTAPAFIVCLLDVDPKPVYEDMSFQIEDCSAAVENILLAIADMGYASVWIDGALRREQRTEKLAKIIQAPSNKTVQILLPVGKPAQQLTQPEKKPFEQRAFFNRYGS